MRPILSLGAVANLRRSFVCTGLLAMTCMLAKPAVADTVTNGNFQTGTLAGWTTFTTSNGSNGTGLPDVVSFNTTGSGASNAAHFNVGEVNFDKTQQGGGLSQAISNLLGGSYTLTADFASQDDADGQVNGAAGIFSILIDGLTVDSKDLGGFLFPHQIFRGSFNETVSLTPGSHTVSIQITRGGLDALTLTPDQYVDNISLTPQSSPSSVPEPSSFALLGTGLLALAGAARRKFTA